VRISKFADEQEQQQIIDDDGVGWEVEFRLQDYTL
jgi:hypothetical protein